MRHLLRATTLLLVLSSAGFPQSTTQAAPPYRPFVVAGDLVYLSGVLPTDNTGAVIAGDIKAQTARVLDILKGRLTEAGSSLDQVAAVTIYLRRASDFAAMNEVYAKYWPKDPPTRTTVAANLVLPEALVEISMIALKTGVERHVVHPASWLRSPSPYSYGIKSGNTLFLAGLVSRNGKDNTTVDGDIKAQTQVALQNAREILGAAGMSFDDVVSARVFLTDVANFQGMNETYRTAFTAAPPARATVRCGLTSPQYLVEITLLAVKDPSRKAITPPNPDGTPGRANPVLSSAIQVGDRLYLSGSLGNTDSNKGDIRAQTTETLARIARTLKAAGFDLKHVVDSTVYLTDVKEFAAMNEAYRAGVPVPFPARATAETGLVVPDGMIEIMMVAKK